MDISREAISTHTLRKEGDLERVECVWRADISTHTLRKEGDYICAVVPV